MEILEHSQEKERCDTSDEKDISTSPTTKLPNPPIIVEHAASPPRESLILTVSSSPAMSTSSSIASTAGGLVAANIEGSDRSPIGSQRPSLHYRTISGGARPRRPSRFNPMDTSDNGMIRYSKKESIFTDTGRLNLNSISNQHATIFSAAAAPSLDPFFGRQILESLQSQHKRPLGNRQTLKTDAQIPQNNQNIMDTVHQIIRQQRQTQIIRRCRSLNDLSAVENALQELSHSVSPETVVRQSSVNDQTTSPTNFTPNTSLLSPTTKKPTAYSPEVMISTVTEALAKYPAVESRIIALKNQEGSVHEQSRRRQSNNFINATGIESWMPTPNTSVNNTPDLQRLPLKFARLKTDKTIIHETPAEGQSSEQRQQQQQSPTSSSEKSEQYYYPGLASPVDRPTLSALTIQRYYRLYKMRQHFSKIRASVKQQQSSMDTLNSSEQSLNVRPLVANETLKRKGTISVLMMLSGGKGMFRAKSIEEKLSSLNREKTTSSSTIDSTTKLNEAANTDSIEASLNDLTTIKKSAFIGEIVNEQQQVKNMLQVEQPAELKQISSNEFKFPEPSTLLAVGKSSENEMADAEAKVKLRKEKLRRRYIHAFNISDPTKAITRMINDECLGSSPQTVAEFLLLESRLSKTKIGEYLGTGEDYQNRVLKALVNQLDFTDLEFDLALRQLLSKFRLPGEAQKIDRIMNEFAQRFCMNNPKVFSTSDTAYVLAFSLIMLNTDAHNPNVKKKMSLQDFIRNNRGIDNNKDLPQEYMQKLYLNIVKNEIKMNENDNLYKIGEICSQITGKFDNIVQPHRRFLREYTCQQIPDINKPNGHRHDRNIFMFNDLLLITKPRIPNVLYHTHSTTIPDNASIVSPTPSGNSGKSNSTLGNTTEPSSNRYQFRYLFNLISMRIIRKPDNPFHQNVIELVNVNGRLSTLSFTTAEETLAFSEALQECIEDVMDIEEEKKEKLQMLTQSRSETAKAALERTYSFTSLAEGTEASAPQSQQTTEQSQNFSLEAKSSIELPQNPQQRRFSKYGNLRAARLALQAQSALITGKNSKKKQLSDKKPPVVEFDGISEKQLADFGVHVVLAAPSPSPEALIEQQKDEKQRQGSMLSRPTMGVIIDEDSPDISSFMSVSNAVDKNPSNSSSSSQPSKLRKRRNTIIG